jgi:hypothetical protein
MPAEASVDEMLLGALTDPRPAVRRAALAVIDVRGGSHELRGRVQDMAMARDASAHMARRVLDRWGGSRPAAP